MKKNYILLTIIGLSYSCSFADSNTNARDEQRPVTDELSTLDNLHQVFVDSLEHCLGLFSTRDRATDLKDSVLFIRYTEYAAIFGLSHIKISEVVADGIQASARTLRVNVETRCWPHKLTRSQDDSINTQCFTIVEDRIDSIPLIRAYSLMDTIWETDFLVRPPNYRTFV